MLLDHLPDGFECRRASKGRPSGEQLVEDRAQAIDIRCRRELLGMAGGLLGRHVGWGAEQRGRPGDVIAAFDDFGQPEVGDVRLAVCVHQEVGGLEVAVENAVFVRIMDRARDCGDQFCR